MTPPGPLPAAGLTAIHDAPLAAVQPQPAAVVTVTLALPAPAPTDTAAGDALKVQPPAGPMVKGFDGELRPMPPGPTAATRAS